MKKVIAHAPAKVNLVLEVEPLGAGEKKHRLNSIFCTTTLTDTLVFDFVAGEEPFDVEVSVESPGFGPRLDSGSDSGSGPDPGPGLNSSPIDLCDNTLTKAVEHFQREYGSGFLPSGTLKVELIKSIPIQAGLGGGSSDAAAMLRMLCWLAQVEPLSERSLRVAQAVGADVPFFLHAPTTGLCAHMDGYGDEMVEAVPKPQMPLCLVKPPQGISTREAFEMFDEKTGAATGAQTAARLARALKEERGLMEIASLCANNLEPAAIELLPALADIKDELHAFPGVLGALLSGAGSTLFAICIDVEAAQSCMQHFADKGLWSVAALT